MSETAVVHAIQHDLELVKKDLAIIKHILSEEGKLSVWAEQEWRHARTTSDTEYISHEALKKRMVK